MRDPPETEEMTSTSFSRSIFSSWKTFWRRSIAAEEKYAARLPPPERARMKSTSLLPWLSRTSPDARLGSLLGSLFSRPCPQAENNDPTGEQLGKERSISIRRTTRTIRTSAIRFLLRLTMHTNPPALAGRPDPGLEGAVQER